MGAAWIGGGDGRRLRVLQLFLLFGLFSQVGWAIGSESTKPDNATCLGCHAQEGLEPASPRGGKLVLKVQEDALKGSVHEDLSCTDCHTGARSWDEVPHNEGQPLKRQCAHCHEKAAEDFDNICIHGKAHATSNPRAPWCNDCHGGHSILPLKSKESVMSPLNQPASCGKCHGSDELSAEDGITKRRLIDRYYESVHWEAVKGGSPAASCSNCHGSHTILPSSDNNSSVSRVNLIQACAKCHSSIVQIFISGSHGRALLHGNLDVPTCVTCHGDHDMMSLKVGSGGKRNFAGTQICIWCHGNERMMKRYALDTSPVESYMRDFHGLTQRGTGGTSATCADCHEPHHSLPSSHPDSRMHLSNRGTACGRCHGKASDTFIMSFSHKSSTPDPGGHIKETVATVYIVVILLIIGGMLVHNGVIWSHSLRRKKRFQRQHALIVRMNWFERVWHWSLLISFVMLVLTGFALKYPESFWFRWIFVLGMTEGIRAWLHRSAAVVMIVSTLYFFFYQLTNRFGRRWLTEMKLRKIDLVDFLSTMKYYLGFGKQRPRYGVFNYAEKAEYWALLWGTLIMVVTGFVLWFPKSLPENTPSWVIEVSRTIHFFEAILAALSILVWHFFHTMFRPEEYPMDTAWLTGVLTENEAKHRFTDEAIQAQIPPAPPPDESPASEPPDWARDGDEEPKD